MSELHGVEKLQDFRVRYFIFSGHTSRTEMFFLVVYLRFVRFIIQLNMDEASTRLSRGCFSSGELYLQQLVANLIHVLAKTYEYFINLDNEVCRTP